MWWDELFSTVAGKLGLPQVLDVSLVEDRAHPPGFLILMGLTNLIGTTGFAARYVALCFGVATVPLLYRLGKLVGGAAVGILAAGLLTISPFHLWYSQEARMYAPLAFLATASSLLFLRMLRHPRRLELLAYTVVNVCGLYLHNLYPLVLLVQLVFLVINRGRYNRALLPWLGANIVAGALYLPWVITVLLTGGYATARIGWIPAANWYEPILSLYSLTLGSTIDPRQLWTWLAPLALGVVSVYAFVLVHGTVQRAQVQFLALWFVMPIVLLYLISLPLPIPDKRSIYMDRFLIQVLPAYLVLGAWGIVLLFRQYPRLLVVVAALAALPMLFSISNNYTADVYARDDWRDVSAFLAQNGDAAHDALLMDLTSILPFVAYPPDPVTRIEVPELTDAQIETWTTTPKNFQGFAHIWTVTPGVPVNVHRFVPDRAEQVVVARQDPFKVAMDAHYPIVQEHWFPGLLLTEYQVTP